MKAWDRNTKLDILIFMKISKSLAMVVAKNVAIALMVSEIAGKTGQELNTDSSFKINLLLLLIVI